MKRNIAFGLLALGLSGAAFAAEPPVLPEKCCCEKMKDEGKPCCPEKNEAGRDGHTGHAGMDHHKS